MEFPRNRLHRFIAPNQSQFWRPARRPSEWFLAFLQPPLFCAQAGARSIQLMTSPCADIISTRGKFTTQLALFRGRLEIHLCAYLWAIVTKLISAPPLPPTSSPWQLSGAGCVGVFVVWTSFFFFSLVYFSPLPARRWFRPIWAEMKNCFLAADSTPQRKATISTVILLFVFGK